jgi:predicted nicotinamide N-methyase
MELVDEVAALDGRELSVVHPRDPESFLDEEAFEREEYMPYWAELWPSGIALARTVWSRSLGGARVVELGCGLALPSIVAARAGARVLATDGHSDAVAFAAHAMALNEVEGEVAVADWAHDGDALAERGPWDLVLGADVLYLKANVEAALALLPRLVAPDGEVLLADPRRAGTRDLLAAARATFSVRTRQEGEVALHRLRRRAR